MNIDQNKQSIDVQPKCIQTRTFDEWRIEGGSKLKKVKIDGEMTNISIDVNINVLESFHFISIHLYGEANVDEDSNIDVYMKKHVLQIILKFEGNRENSNLKLDVILPKEKALKKISFEHFTGNIAVGGDINVNKIRL